MEVVAVPQLRRPMRRRRMRRSAARLRPAGETFVFQPHRHFLIPTSCSHLIKYVFPPNSDSSLIAFGLRGEATVQLVNLVRSCELVSHGLGESLVSSQNTHTRVCVGVCLCATGNEIPHQTLV